MGGRCDDRDSCRHRPREPALLSSDALREQHSDADRRTSGSVVEVVLLVDRADSDRPVVFVVVVAGPRRSSPSRSRSQLGNRKQCMAALLCYSELETPPLLWSPPHRGKGRRCGGRSQARRSAPPPIKDGLPNFRWAGVKG